MTITVNGEPRELDATTTLDALLVEVAGTTRGSAAVVDGAVVPRGEWPVFELRDGADVQVITAVQGG